MDSLGFDLVLLAHHSTPNIWKEKIVENGLIGDLWHLSDEQFSFFEDFFHATRKPHPRYDKILDRENFMLMMDANGEMTTMNAIQFRETGFFYISSLPYYFKAHLRSQQRKVIDVGAVSYTHLTLPTKA